MERPVECQAAILNLKTFRMSGVVPLSQAIEQMNDYTRLPDSQYDSATHDSSGYQNE